MLENGFYISIHKEKQIAHINCINNSTTLDCKTIHNIIFENTQENEASEDIGLQDLYSYEIYVFLDSILLNGSKEIESNPLYFGSMDSKDLDSKLDETKPIYYLESNNDEYNKESSNSLSTLNIFLNNSKLIILNYSILNSSLNIKLECKSKESKEILEKEKQAKETIESKIKDSTSLPTQNTAFLHPVLEDNELKCPHNGVVKLKSNKGKNFKSNNIPMILESDLLNSTIIGCTNNIAGIPTPCMQVALILPTARALKKYNNDYPIMQDLVNGNVFSDKGFPLIATHKSNTFRINSPKPSNTKDTSKEALVSAIDTSLPSFHIITPFKELGEFYLTPTYYENRECNTNNLISTQSKFYDTYTELDLGLDTILTHKNTLDASNMESNSYLKDILDSILLDYPKGYFSYRIFSIRVAYSIYEYLLIVPKSIPKFVVKILKEKRDKDSLAYGYGKFVDLSRDYVRKCSMGEGKNGDNTGISLLNIQGKVLLAPSGCERVRVEVR